MSINTPWTDDSLRVSFDRFMLEHGRLPTANEVDDCLYLPSSRQIQRAFGGLRALRQRLGYEVLDYTRGDLRREVARGLGTRGLVAERELERLLIDHFGEVYVHSEQRYGKKGSRVDFMVYSPSGTFGVDIFVTADARNLQKILNIKLPKYVDFPTDRKLYFVCFSEVLSEAEMDYSGSKVVKFNQVPSASLIGYNSFLGLIDQLVRYDDPKFLPRSVH